MSYAAIIVVLWAACAAGVLTLRHRNRRLRLPIATLVIATVVTVVSVVGELDAEVLDALRRDTPRLLSGEWWRVLTPLLVQDGGWAGLVFNVIALLAVGAVAEALLRRRVVVLTFAAVGLIGEAAAYTVMPGQGFAGNSVANLGIASTVLVAALFRGDRRARIPAVAALTLGGAVLLAMWDLHAVGLIAGTVIGLLLAGYERRESTADSAVT